MHFWYVTLNLTKDAAGKQEQVCDKEMEAKFNLMLKGKMDNLPHLPRSVVRIFISSTFSGKMEIFKHDVNIKFPTQLFHISIISALAFELLIFVSLLIFRNLSKISMTSWRTWFCGWRAVGGFLSVF